MKKFTILISIILAANMLSGQWYKHPQFCGWPYHNQNTDIFFADENNGWVVSGSLSNRTTDGGNNWETMLMFGNSTSICFSDQDHGWSVGAANSFGYWISNSENGGISWYNQACNIAEDDKLYSVTFADSLKGWAVGGHVGACFALRGVIVATFDGGNTWEVQYEGEGIFSDVFFLNDSVGWALKGSVSSELGNVLLTENGGNIWIEHGDSCNGNSIYFLDSLNGYIAGGGDFSGGNMGWILKTINGGHSWSMLVEDTIPILTDIYFTDAFNGYAIGHSGTILYTSDAGETWSYQESGTYANLNSICFTDINHGWICGDSNIVLYTNNGGIVSLDETDKLLKDIHLYPNPCKDLININYEFENAGHLKCEIINMQGESMYSNNFYSTGRGTTEKTINMSGLPCGIYIIRLITRGETHTQKVIKSK